MGTLTMIRFLFYPFHSLSLTLTTQLLGVLLLILILLGLVGQAWRKRTVVSTTITRVLIAQFNPILGAGIESLLTQDTDIVLLTVCPRDRCALIQAICDFQPHAVVLAGQTIFGDMIELIRLTSQIPQLRFISVSLQDDLIQIIDKKEIALNESNEFASVVRNGSGKRWSEEQEDSWMRRLLLEGGQRRAS